MRVALVLDGMGFGGIERVAVNYTKLFMELGYEVDIYNLKPQFSDMESEFPTACRIYRKSLPDVLLPEHYLPMIKRWNWGKYLYPVAFAGSKFLLYLYRLTMGRRKKYDITVAFSGHYRDLTFTAYNFVKSRKKLGWIHGALMGFILASYGYGLLYLKLKNMCTLSAANEGITLRNNPYLAKVNITQIYNPMELTKDNVDVALVTELREKYGRFILMIGRFAEDKDQKTVIHAMKELVDKYGRKEKLLFVGAGDTLEECRQLAEQLGLSEQIVFVGARYDVQNFYTASGLFVHSSPAEGLPTVLLEAMKYDAPVVATDSPPGVTEILCQDEYGLRCEVGNPSDMADKMNRMLTDDALREHYVVKGRERLQDFSYETIKNQLRDILEELR